MKLKVSSSLKLWGDGSSIEGGAEMEVEIPEDAAPNLIRRSLLRTRYILDSSLIQAEKLRGVASQKHLDAMQGTLYSNYKEYGDKLKQYGPTDNSLLD